MEKEELWGGQQNEQDPEKKLEHYEPPKNDPELEEALLETRREIQKKLGVDDKGEVVENGEGE